MITARRLLPVVLPAIVAALSLPGARAGAQLVTNGSFETSATISNPGTFATLAAGSTAIDGWTVGTGAGIDYIGTYWQAADGNRSIDLSGLGAGGIFQDIPTLPGTIYHLSFALAGNTDGNPVTKSVLVSAGGASKLFTFDATGRSHAAMGWQLFSMSFVALAGPTSRIEFASQDATPFGPALDNVAVVSAVPEPATMALVGTGLGLVGVAARRRRKSA